MQSEQRETGARERPAVLYVDDEPRSIKYFVRAFEHDFRIRTAASVAEAEELLASDSDEVGVLITDQRMPVQTGVQLLNRTKTRYPDIVRLLTTAYADLDDAVSAVNRGEIFRYILKPWDINILRGELQDALDLYRRQRHDRDLLQARRHTIMSLASHIAHELSTPLSTIHTAVDNIGKHLPELVRGYRQAVGTGHSDGIPEPMLALLNTTPSMVVSLVNRTNMLIRLLLMNAAEDAKDRSGYLVFPLRLCIEHALRTYPFKTGERNLVTLEGPSFEVFGSELLLSYVIYNLLKNSLDAISEARKGEVVIRLKPGPTHNHLLFRDTGAGIPQEMLPRVFEEFYSGKGAGRGTGMGLPFCRRVLSAFGGEIGCHSRNGEYTELKLTFPRVGDEQLAPQRTGDNKK